MSLGVCVDHPDKLGVHGPASKVMELEKAPSCAEFTWTIMNQRRMQS